MTPPLCYTLIPLPSFPLSDTPLHKIAPLTDTTDFTIAPSFTANVQTII